MWIKRTPASGDRRGGKPIIKVPPGMTTISRVTSWLSLIVYIVGLLIELALVLIFISNPDRYRLCIQQVHQRLRVPLEHSMVLGKDKSYRD